MVCYSQIYFEGLYGESESSGEGVGIAIPLEDGYLGWCYSYGNLQSYLLRTDELGNLLYDIHLPKPDSLSYLSSHAIRLSDTLFLGLSLKENLNMPFEERGDYALTKFGINGSVISEWVLGDSSEREIPQYFIGTSDGGYLLTGQAQVNDSGNIDGQMQAILIDDAGNLMWEQLYGGSLFDSGGGVVQTNDGGFLLLGWTRSFSAGQRDFYLVKTDSLGNEEWFETYGGNGNEGGWSITSLSDGNYLLVGGGSNDGETSFGRLIKVDILGGHIWTKDYSMQDGNSLFSSLELQDGSLVSAGLTTIPSESNAGWILKTDSNGEMLWQRKYNRSNQVDLFYNLLATEDGGFLLSGQAVNDTTGSQDAWLLKVDSVGCAYPNCTVGVNELEPTEIVVDVWPNPATSVIHLEIGRLLQGKVELVCTKMNGQVIHTEVISTNTTRLKVNDWSKGLYLLTIRGDDFQTSVRVAVQH